MFRHILGVAVLAVGLAACGGKEEPAGTPTETGDTTEMRRLSEPSAVVTAPENEGELVYRIDNQRLTQVFQSSDQVSIAPGETTVTLTRTADGEEKSAGKTSGAFVPFKNPKDDPDRYNNELIDGKTIRVAVHVSAAGTDATPFKVAFSTSRKGASAWAEFEATPELAWYTFDYDVESGEDDNPDFIGFTMPMGESIVVDAVQISVLD